MSNTVTAYSLHTTVNAAFEAAGVTRRIPPQMVYNYLRNGLITGVKGGGQEITVEQATAWLTKYLTKHVPNVSLEAVTEAE